MRQNRNCLWSPRIQRIGVEALHQEDAICYSLSKK
eukprot:gene2512-1568_t